MKNLFRFLSVLCGTALCFTVAHAQTLSIKDNQAPHRPRARSEQFATTLIASVQDPPKDHDEIKIFGPTYEWSSGDSVVKIIPSNTVTSGLDSADRRYQKTGDYSVTVTCKAIYTSVDTSESDAKPVTLSPIIGTKEVKFHVRVPTAVEWTGEKSPNFQLIIINMNYATTVFSPYDGSYNFWGAGDVYQLKLVDDLQEHYGFGKVKEDFTNISPKGELPNGKKGGATFTPPVWPDTIEKRTDIDPGPYPHFVTLLSYTQLWSSLEDGYSPYLYPAIKSLYTAIGLKEMVNRQIKSKKERT